MNERMLQLQEWLKKAPNDAFLNYALAIEFIGQNKDREAEKVLNMLIETQPNYFASYYHLGQLQERKGDEAAAIETYKKGMEITKSLGETHAFGELRSVLEELEF